jgi:5-formyltetrahydrofolate cyclo-ligase
VCRRAPGNRTFVHDNCRMPPAADQPPSPPEPGRDGKGDWRRALRRARRESLPGRDRTADATRIADTVATLVAGRAPVSFVSAYVSLPTEPPTEALIERLVGIGVGVLVPELLPDRDLDWRPVTGATPHGAPELGERLGTGAIGRAGLVIVPALAVDAEGVRLGQGGGSYDRALTRRRPDAFVVALVHDGEVFPAGRLPREPHDAPVDGVITPGGGLLDLKKRFPTA